MVQYLHFVETKLYKSSHYVLCNLLNCVNCDKFCKNAPNSLRNFAKQSPHEIPKQIKNTHHPLSFDNQHVNQQR